MKELDKQFTRRMFLTKSGYALTAVTGLTLVANTGCATMPAYHGVYMEGILSVRVSAIPELQKERSIVLINAQGLSEAILLMRLDAGSFRALSGTCTHLGCIVKSAGSFLQCPCHGSTYNLDGEVIRGPAPSALHRYRVTNEKGVLTIEISG